MFEFLESLDISKELIIFICSMAPVIELRGAIPLGISLNIHPMESAIIAIVGNMFVLFLLLNLLEPVMRYFEKTRLFNGTIGWIKRRSMKRAGVIKKYSLFGLLIFVAIPLPTTGVWTGSVIASLLKLEKKKSFVMMSLGLLVAASIILALYYGIIH